MISAHVKFEDHYFVFTTPDSGQGLNVSYKKNGINETKNISPGGGYNDIRFLKSRISEWLHRNATYSDWLGTSRSQPRVKFITITTQKDRIEEHNETITMP